VFVYKKHFPSKSNNKKQGTRICKNNTNVNVFSKVNRRTKATLNNCGRNSAEDREALSQCVGGH
jgi:hypothetical protein